MRKRKQLEAELGKAQHNEIYWRDQYMELANEILAEGPLVEILRPSDFAQDVHVVFSEAEELLLQKHHDYGPKNISQSPGGPLNGLRVRMWDKMARINNLLDSGVEPQNESLRDSYLDLLCYSAIALMVLDGNWPTE